MNITLKFDVFDYYYPNSRVILWLNFFLFIFKLIWLVAFGATVLLDITYGLALAVAFSVVTVMLREQWPKFHRVSPKSGERGDNVLEQLQKCKKIK